MSLREAEAVRMAVALDDYEDMAVTDIGGTEDSGNWLCVTNERFGLTCDIDSHADYWNFLGYFCAGLMWPVKLFPRKGMA